LFFHFLMIKPSCKCEYATKIAHSQKVKVQHAFRMTFLNHSKGPFHKKQLHLHRSHIYAQGKQQTEIMDHTPKTPKLSSMVVTIQLLPAHVWHREFLSMTPWRGSIRPWSLGLPPSYVSGKRIPPSVTDIRRYKRKNVFITSVNIKILYCL